MYHKVGGRVGECQVAEACTLGTRRACVTYEVTCEGGRRWHASMGWDESPKVIDKSVSGSAVPELGQTSGAKHSLTPFVRKVGHCGSTSSTERVGTVDKTCGSCAVQ